jgi:hypothetical protein
MKTDEETNFNYSAVPGKDNVIKVSFKDDGQNKSVMIETFSDAQFDLFNRAKKRAEELAPDLEKQSS